MTREETKKIIRIMMATYPNFHPQDITETVDVWTMMLEEYSYQEISVALKNFILSDSSGFAPSVGQLTMRIANRQIQPMEALEAWSLVCKAIGNSNYHAEEEYDKLPVPCQKAIGTPANLREMAMMDMKTVHSVEQSHFIRAYDTIVKRMKEELRLPEGMRIEFKGNVFEGIKKNDEGRLLVGTQK